MTMRRRTFLSAASACVAAPAVVLGAAPSIKLRDLYAPDGSFSEIVHANIGSRVVVQGFMAPPLKAEPSFFVLTKLPMSVCPFCENAADWPSDILAVYTKRRLTVVPFTQRIDVSGVIETGEFRDPDTGFFSLLRLTDAVYS